jgi:hypothetical protein
VDNWWSFGLDLVVWRFALAHHFQAAKSSTDRPQGL